MSFSTSPAFKPGRREEAVCHYLKKAIVQLQGGTDRPGALGPEALQSIWGEVAGRAWRPEFPRPEAEVWEALSRRLEAWKDPGAYREAYRS